MKILIINRHLPPEFESSLITCMLNIAIQLIKRGHEVHFLGITKDQNTDTSKPFYFEISRSPQRFIICHRIYLKSSNPVFENFFFIRAALEKFHLLAIEHKYDIINIHESRFPMLILKHIYKTDVKIIYTFHASVAWEYKYDFLSYIKKKVLHENKVKIFLKKTKAVIRYIPNYLWLRYCEKKALCRVDEIHAASKFVQNQIINFYKRQKNIHSKIKIIPFGTDYQFFSRSRVSKERKKHKEKAKNEIHIFTLRRLVDRMGLPLLIQAVYDVNKSSDLVFKLTIGGKGPLMDELQQLCKNINAEYYVHFAGFIAQEKLPDYYAQSDIFVIPSEELEGFGLVILEAMGMGLPVLGSTAGAIPEILDSAPYCRLFTKNNRRELVQQLQEMGRIAATFEEFKRNEIREHAIINFNWENYTDAFLGRQY